MNKYLDPGLLIGPPLIAARPLARCPRETYPLRDLLVSLEIAIIETTLRATNGNQRRAANALGLLPTTLKEKMKRYGLRSVSEASSPSSRPRAPKRFKANQPTKEHV